ncbi:hypothetical protein [Polluticoccus soli]|uniref:hypothetical protein n=1 Tax=Polluticoccus soli TaxID=3034150 RepID=UPI0023E0FC1A|nr:hypothetical protein [Flavipsychrobacter sp. JY13-12]
MKPPDEHIPPKAAIIPYYLVAAFAFVLLSVLCLIAGRAFTGHYFQPRILAITHLAVFGWATMIIFGASNQLAPVICERRLYNEKLPVPIIALLTSGAALLVTSFWNFTLNTPAYIGGALILTAVILHAWNIYKTASAGKENIVRDFMLIAHLWLAITCTIGILLLVNLGHPFLPEEHLFYLKIHASIGMAGWFLQLIIGVSSKLIPMFLLSRTEEKKLLNISYYTINIGLTLLLLEGLVFRASWGRLLYFVLILAGIVAYGRYVRICYKTAMRKQLDNGMKQTFIALTLISVPFVLLLIALITNNNVSPSTITAFGFAFFGGFISTIIMGQTFKTLPFIVWMHITKPNTLPEVMPKDLFNEKWVKGQMLAFLPGYILFLAGILLRQTVPIYSGATLMILASAWYFIHVVLIIKKLENGTRHNR